MLRNRACAFLSVAAPEADPMAVRPALFVPGALASMLPRFFPGGTRGIVVSIYARTIVGFPVSAMTLPGV